MSNKNILAGTLVVALLATTAAYAANTEISNNFKFGKQKIELTDEQKAQMQEAKALFEKVKNWETLTSDEQAKVDEFKANMPQRWERKQGWGFEKRWFDNKWKWPRGEDWFGWRWGFGWGFHNLTDEEKTQLESLSDEAKEEFFETKRAEQETKLQAKEAVIDKLLNGEVLTDADKVIVEEIKAARAEQKERKAQAESLKALFEKSKNWETLTADEQAKLDELKANMPQRWFGEKFKQRKNNDSRDIE